MKYVNFVILISALLFSACTLIKSDDWKTRVEAVLENGDYDKAIQILSDALKKEPNNAELNYYMGHAHRLVLFDDGAEINTLDLSLAEEPTEYFKRSILIDPLYKGNFFSVGPYTKIQSIWSSVAMTHIYAGDMDKAISAFKRGKTEGGFYPAILEINRDIMATCEKNAILFTNGDNDTHPMWYLQLIEKYRTDITVVNLSLLGVDWYVKQLKNNYPFGENTVDFGLSDEEIEKVDLVEWIAKKVEIPAQGDHLNSEGKISWLLQPTIQNIYLRNQDQFLLKIIENNKWKRPVYFAITVSKQNKIGLDDYISLHGLALKLEKHVELMNTDILENNLLNTYSYEGLDDKNLQYSFETGWMYYNYRVCFGRLSNLNMNQGNIRKASQLLKTMDEKIPEGILPYPSPNHKDLMNELRRRIKEKEKKQRV